jgi:hypothetical protein
VQTFWRTGRNIKAKTCRLLRFHRNNLLRILVKFATSVLMLQYEQFFDRDLENGAVSIARIQHITESENTPNSGICRRILLTSILRTENGSQSPEPSSSSHNTSESARDSIQFSQPDKHSRMTTNSVSHRTNGLRLFFYSLRLRKIGRE